MEINPEVGLIFIQKRRVVDAKSFSNVRDSCFPLLFDLQMLNKVRMLSQSRGWF